MVEEGDVVQSPRGTISRVLDLATCTETGKSIVIHSNKVGTLTTPLTKFQYGGGYRVIRKRWKHGDY